MGTDWTGEISVRYWEKSFTVRVVKLWRRDLAGLGITILDEALIEQIYQPCSEPGWDHRPPDVCRDQSCSGICAVHSNQNGSGHQGKGH